MFKPLFPELMIYDRLNAIKDFIYNDVNNLPTEAVLYSMFGGDNDSLLLGNFDFKQNTIDYWKQNKDKYFKHHVGFNISNVDDYPVCHIIIPSINHVQHSIGGINDSEKSFIDNSYDTNSVSVPPVRVKNDDLNAIPIVREIHETQYDTRFGLVFTGMNADMILIVANTIFYMLHYFRDQMEMDGFLNIKFGQSELTNVLEIEPPKFYSRVITLDFNFFFNFMDSRNYGLQGKKLIIDETKIND